MRTWSPTEHRLLRPGEDKEPMEQRLSSDDVGAKYVKGGFLANLGFFLYSVIIFPKGDSFLPICTIIFPWWDEYGMKTRIWSFGRTLR